MTQKGPSAETGSDRSFGLIWAAVFLLIGLWPLLADQQPGLWALIIAALFTAVALFNAKLLHPLNRLWQRFGLLLGSIITPVIMALLFFLVVTPTGLIMRARKKDLLRLKIEPDRDSYWIARETPPGSMKNQF